MTQAPVLHELIAMAQAVRIRIESNPVRQMPVQQRFADLFGSHGHALDPDMFEAACGLMRAAIGPETDDYLFAFPYPHLVGAALAIEGRAGDGSNMALDFLDQYEQDYPEGTCVADCDGVCPDFEETGCDRTCTGACHHADAIRAAYDRAGRTAFWLDNFQAAAASVVAKHLGPVPE